MLLLGTAGVLKAHVNIPVRGPAIAEVLADSESDITGSVTLAEEGGISLRCTVVRGGVNPALLRWEGTIVGGAGGLGLPVRGSFQAPQLGDVLNSIATQSGETLATISSTVTGVTLSRWTLGQCSAAAALDLLADAATQALGAQVNWRILPAGTLWMGTETWPAQAMQADSEIVDPSPLVPFVTIAAAVPWLLPGVDLEGAGRIATAEHWIEPASVRTWAWS